MILAQRIARAFEYLRQGRLLQRLAEQPRRIRGARRSRWWSAHRGDGKGPVVTLSSGSRLQLYFDSKLCETLYCWGFEQEEQDFVARFLREGDVFADVGANIGLFSVIASRLVGRSGRVFAFEPAAFVRERLAENLRLNGCSNVTVLPVALSDADESRSMAVFGGGFDAWSTLASPSNDRPSSSETVSCLSLDTVSAMEPDVRRAALVKIDVEGWESHVLRGGPGFLRGDEPRVLMIEFSREPQERAGSSYEELWQDLKTHGFSIFRLPGSRGNAVEITSVPDDDYVNLLATRFPEFLRQRLARRGGA